MKLAGFARFAAAGLIVLLAALGLARAATDFPALTGRVVDQAGVLSAVTKADLEGKLASLEEKSGIQLVVATVASLDGQEIEPYANDLFRYWKLGEAKKNNGALLLVAPKEHRVRIEVGYGLEGTLTDATSKIIILNAITPRFKAGDFNGGVTRGVEDIITVLTTDSSEWQKKPDLRSEDQAPALIALAPLLILLVIFFIFIKFSYRGSFWSNLAMLAANSSQGGSSSGGGFSSGGGGGGGGGASGDW